MRKLIATLLICSVASVATADTWWWGGGSYAYTWDSVSAENTWYDIDQAHQTAGNLNGSFFGSFLPADELFLNSELNVGSNEGNFDNVALWWRIGLSGEWTGQSVGTTLVDGEHYRGTTPGIDLIDAVGGVAGNYTVQVLVSRTHSWDGGTWSSIIGHDGTDPTYTQFTHSGGQGSPIGSGEFPTTDFFEATFTVIPEPTSLALIGIGVFGLLALRRRR